MIATRRLVCSQQAPGWTNEDEDKADAGERNKTNGENIRGHEGHDTGSGITSQDELS